MTPPPNCAPKSVRSSKGVKKSHQSAPNPEEAEMFQADARLATFSDRRCRARLRLRKGHPGEQLDHEMYPEKLWAHRSIQLCTYNRPKGRPHESYPQIAVRAQRARRTSRLRNGRT